jgi:hypothetical protein
VESHAGSIGGVGEFDGLLQERINDSSLPGPGDDLTLHEGLALAVSVRGADIGVPDITGAVDKTVRDGETQWLRNALDRGLGLRGELVDVHLQASEPGA